MADLKILEYSTKRKKRNLYTCFTAKFLEGFGNGFFIILQPILLDITSSLFNVGLILTFAILVQIVSNPLIGRLVDRFGPKSIWLIGESFNIFGCIILLLTSNYVLVGMAVVLIFLGKTTTEMNIQLIISESSTESKKGSNFSFKPFAFFCSSIFSSFLIMLDIGLDYRFYIWTLIIVSLIIWITVFFFITNLNSVVKKAKNEVSPNPKPKSNNLSNLFQNPQTRIIIVFFTLHYFFIGITQNIWNAWMVETYGVSEQDLGLFFFCAYVTLVIFQILAGRIIDKIGNKKALLLSFLFLLLNSIIAIIVYFSWSNGFRLILIPGTIIATIFFAVYSTVISPVESIYLTNLTEKRKAQSYGDVHLVIASANIPSGVIGGSLADFVHPIAPEIVSFGGGLFLTWFLIKYFDSWKKELVDDSS